MANQFTTSAPPNLTIEQITDGLLFGDRFWNPSDFTFSIPGAGASWTGYTAGHEQASADYGVLTLAQADQFRAAVAQWDKLIAPNFTETNDATSPGNIRAAFSEYGSNSNDGVWGYAYAPPVGGGSSVLSGDIWIGAEVKGSTFAEGSYDFMALLHELGHAIGMKHSFEAPKIPKAYDNHRFTVMSYTDQKDLYWVNFTHPDASHIQANFTDVNASTPMVLDIAAIQELYGADATTGAGNTVYHFSEDDPFMLAIYDAGGKDTFDLSGLARGSEVDLRSGAYSSVGYYSAADQKADAKAANPGFSASFFDSVYSSVTPYTWSDNVGIAFSTVIENATGGSGDDSLLGNSAKNSLKGGGGGDTLSGGGKGDILIGGSGKDI
ncbi:MAG: M10 family metallopeptidase, partial [Caulobacteraceae bacterium]